MKAKRAKREHRQYDSLPIIAYNQELQREIKSIRKDYSFTANPNLSTRSNVANRLRQLTLVELFNNCLNRSCHNLCKTTKVPRAATRLLGLGLKFCVTDKPPPTNMSDIDIKRFRENIRTKYFFIDKTETDDSYEPKIYVRSPNWKAPEASKHVEQAIDYFERMIKSLVSRRETYNFRPNLLRSELTLLRSLKENETIIILNSDKNLGPVIMEYSEYVTDCLRQHLLNEKYYQYLTPDQATKLRSKAYKKMWNLIARYDKDDIFNEAERKYFEHKYKLYKSSTMRISQFYGAPKVHKTPILMRPIVSTVSTVLEILAVFLDYKLQEVVHLCVGYLKDSWDLLRDIQKLDRLPPNARLITIDAVSMYSNIDTEHALQVLEKWFELHKDDIN